MISGQNSCGTSRSFGGNFATLNVCLMMARLHLEWWQMQRPVGAYPNYEGDGAERRSLMTHTTIARVRTRARTRARAAP